MRAKSEREIVKCFIVVVFKLFVKNLLCLLKNWEKIMTYIHLRIPDDLQENLSQIAEKEIE